MGRPKHEIVLILPYFILSGFVSCSATKTIVAISVLKWPVGPTGA